MNKDQEEFESAVKKMLNIVGEDIHRDGLKGTPKRVYKSFMDMTSGYKEDPILALKSAMFKTCNSEMILIKNIDFYSLCEHHILPIIGQVHVGYIPKNKIVGLSKIPRVVDILTRRLQIQEKLTEDIVNTINDTVDPKGVGVIIQARHLCMEIRGVKKVANTTTSSLRGIFLDSLIKKEFYSLINSK